MKLLQHSGLSKYFSSQRDEIMRFIAFLFSYFSYKDDVMILFKRINLCVVIRYSNVERLYGVLGDIRQHKGRNSIRKSDISGTKASSQHDSVQHKGTAVVFTRHNLHRSGAAKASGPSGFQLRFLVPTGVFAHITRSREWEGPPA